MTQLGKSYIGYGGFDYSALKKSVSYAEAKRATPTLRKKYLQQMGVFALFGVIMIAVITNGMIKGVGGLQSGVALFFVFLIFVGPMIFAYLSMIRHIKGAYRLKLFADANGFTHVYDQPVESGVPLPIVFSNGWDKYIEKAIEGVRNGTEFRIGAYGFVTGRARSARSRQFVFASIKLDAQQQNILFASNKTRIAYTLRYRLPLYLKWTIGLHKVKSNMHGDEFTVYARENIDTVAVSPALASVMRQYADRYYFETWSEYVFVYGLRRNIVSEEFIGEMMSIVDAVAATKNSR